MFTKTVRVFSFADFNFFVHSLGGSVLGWTRKYLSTLAWSRCSVLRNQSGPTERDLLSTFNHLRSFIGERRRDTEDYPIREDHNVGQSPGRALLDLFDSVKPREARDPAAITASTKIRLMGYWRQMTSA